MGFVLTSGELLSRIIRANQIDGQFDNLIENNGLALNVRTINDSINFIDEYDDNGGLLNTFWNLGRGTVGFLFKFVKGIVFSATAIVSWLKAGFDALVNFDFNASELSLNNQLKALNAQLSSVWGGFIGEVFGTAASLTVSIGVSALIGAGVGVFLPAVSPLISKELIRAVALETLRERVPEILATLGNAIQQTGRVLVAYTFVKSYIGIRNFIKSLFPNNPQIQNWGKGKRWTIRESFQNLVENISGEDWFENAVEEASEEFYDAFWETGFVFADNFDRAIYEAQIMRDGVLGNEIPQVTIDLDSDGLETVVLPNQRSIIAQQQVITEINQFRRIRNRDVGQLVGERLRDNISKVKPPLTLLLQWAYFEQPPFYRGDINYLPQCEIPGIKRSQIEWDTIKAAMGGANGYNWGRFKASVRLTTNTGDKVQPFFLYGGSAEEVEDRARALLSLSDYQIVSFSITEELKEGRKASGRSLYKETARIYPAYATLVNSQKIINEEDGRATLTGTYRNKRDRIEMFSSIKPSNFDEIIADILTIPGTNNL